MVSAVSSTTFANRKPTLTGSATLSEDTTGFDTFAPNTAITQMTTGRFGNMQNFEEGINDTSVTVTTPTGDDVLVVVAGAAAMATAITGGGGTWFVRLLDGTTILKTQAFSPVLTNERSYCMNALFVGVPLAGSRTYNLQTYKNDSDGVLYGVALRVSHVKLTDTQATKNINIIGG